MARTNPLGTDGTGNDIAGGGGGGGGVLYAATFNVTQGTSYPVTVGAGGATALNTIPLAGSNSSFASLVAAGGGYGAGWSGGAYYPAGPGASGGGGAFSFNTGAAAFQGYAGGSGTSVATSWCVTWRLNDNE